MIEITITPSEYGEAARVSHDAFRQLMADKMEEAGFDPDSPILQKVNTKTGTITLIQKTQADILDEKSKEGNTIIERV